MVPKDYCLLSKVINISDGAPNHVPKGKAQDSHMLGRKHPLRLDTSHKDG